MKPLIQSGCKPLPRPFTADAEEIDRPAARLVAASAQQLFQQARNALKAQAAAGQEDSFPDSNVNTLLEDLEDEGSDSESNTESPAMDPVQPDLNSGYDALVASNLAGLLIAAAFPDRVAQKRSRGNRCVHCSLRMGTHPVERPLAGTAIGRCKAAMLCHPSDLSKSNRFQNEEPQEQKQVPSLLLGDVQLPPAVWWPSCSASLGSWSC